MKLPFSVGDLAVYPMHGLAEIVALEQRDVAGRPLKIYVLEVLGNRSRIMIPTTKIADVGLREPVSEKELPEVYAILRSRDTVHNDQAWNRRHREYMDKIKTGSIFEIAEVLRDLRLLGENKHLSFSERRVAETAQSLLVQEIAMARHAEPAEISREIDELFAAAA